MVDSLSMFVESKPGVALRMCQLAEVKEDDVVYDLGCGDARVLIEAAQNFKSKCVGLEIDCRYITKAKESVKLNGVEDLVSIEEQDCMRADLSGASVVYLFLTEYGMLKVRPIIVSQLRPGSRVVTCMTPIGGGWEPEEVSEDPGLGQVGRLYLYRVSEKIKGKERLLNNTDLDAKFKDYQPPKITEQARRLSAMGRIRRQKSQTGGEGKNNKNCLIM